MNFFKQQQIQHPPFFTKEIHEKIEKLGTFDKSKLKAEEVKGVAVKGKPNLIIRNILSKEECDILIEETEKTGYEEAEKFCFMYRDRLNDRMMSDDKKFSEFIWERCKHLVPTTYVKNGVEWEIDNLNPRWRFCKYTKGHFFGPHTDGSYPENSNRKSFLTFMFYLNSPNDGAYKGGSTNFLKYDSFKKNEKDIILKVVPDTGMALIFLQEDVDYLHEGALLEEGTKYILRTDVMYNRKQ